MTLISKFQHIEVTNFPNVIVSGISGGDTVITISSLFVSKMDITYKQQIACYFRPWDSKSKLPAVNEPFVYGSPSVQCEKETAIGLMQWLMAESFQFIEPVCYSKLPTSQVASGWVILPCESSCYWLTQSGIPHICVQFMFKLTVKFPF